MARIVVKATRPVLLAAAGAPAPLRAHDRLYERGEPILLGPKETLEVGVPASLARSYLAISQGFHPAPRARPLKVGDVLLCESPGTLPPNRPPCVAQEPPRLSILPCTSLSIPQVLWDTVYRVGYRSNRVGIRLEGPPLPAMGESLSEPTCHGTIQVDNSGSLIVLGPDGPTLGGYPKLGVIASRHLHHLAQLRPGAEVRFTLEA